MGALCASSCCPAGDLAPPVAYSTCDKYTRTYGYKRFILIQCDVEFTDVTDVSEWATYLAAGQISCSPSGKLTINAPTETLYEYDDCGGKLVIDTEYAVDYTTPFAAADKSDFQYWKDVKNTNATMAILGCDGCVYFNQGTAEEIYANTAGNAIPVTGQSAGLDFSVSVTPYQANQQGIAEWTTQFTISSDGVFCGVEIEGLEAALCC